MRPSNRQNSPIGKSGASKRAADRKRSVRRIVVMLTVIGNLLSKRNIPRTINDAGSVDQQMFCHAVRFRETSAGISGSPMPTRTGAASRRRPLLERWLARLRRRLRLGARGRVRRFAGHRLGAQVLQHDDLGADADAVGEVDDMAVEHAEAARRGRDADRAGVVGAVDAIERVAEIERLGAERIADAAESSSRAGAGRARASRPADANRANRRRARSFPCRSR